MRRLDFSENETFLALYAKYEYFKRNSAANAWENINKMIRKEHSQNSPLKRNKRKADDSNVAHQKAKFQKLDEEYQRVEDVENIPEDALVPTKGKSPGMDSDSSEVDRLTPDVPTTEGSYKFFKVQALYEKMVEKEVFGILLSANNRREDLSGDDILNMLSIHRTTSSLLSRNLIESLFLHIDKLRVTISFYGIIFEFYNSKLKSWSKSIYWKHPQGTMIWNADKVYLISSRYQNRAALDFFYLVKHPEAKFEELEFKIEKYRSWNLKMAPFDKFFGKIRNLLALRKVHVTKWSMEYFKHKDDTILGPKVVRSVWSILKVEELESIRIRKWDDKHLETESNTNDIREIWANLMNVKHLDVDDSVKIGDFMRLRNLKTIRMNLQQRDFRAIVEVFNQHPPERCEIYSGPQFDFETAKRGIKCEQKMMNSYYFRTGLLIRFDENSKEKRVVLMRRDQRCAR